MEAERIAIIGCGKQAEKHIMGYRANGQSDITVADIHPDIASAFGRRVGVRHMADVDDLIGSRAITAVDICTPTQTHSPLLLNAISNGKNFLVEKPLTATLDQAVSVLARTQVAGLVGAVGFTYRFAPAFVKIRTLIKENSLGQIGSAHFRIGGRGSQALWKHQSRSGGGAIREMLVHMLDLAIWFFGPVDTVKVLASELHHPSRFIQGHSQPVDAEDFVVVTLKMVAGQSVTITADFNTPGFVQYAEIQGSDATAFGSIQPHFPNFIWRARSGSGFPSGRTDLTCESRNIVADLTADFLAALQGRSAPRCPLSEAVEVQRALQKILAQARA